MTLHGRSDFADVVKVRILISLDYSGRSNVITRVLIRRKKEGLRRRGDNGMSDGEARSWGMWVASMSYKVQGSLAPANRTHLC